MQLRFSPNRSIWNLHRNHRKRGGPVRNGKKPRQQIAQGGFPCPGPAHNSEEHSPWNMEVYSLETQLGLPGVSEGQVFYPDFASADRHRRRGVAFAKRRSNVHKRLDPGKRRNSALKQVRHPAHSHHRPGHYKKIADEGDKIPRRNSPGYSQTSPENQHQQHAEVSNEAGYREKRPVDKRQLEIVVSHKFHPFGQSAELDVPPGCTLLPGEWRTASSGQIQLEPKTVPGLS